jgi:hypothetical protein
MKTTATIILALLLGYHLAGAQDSTKLKSFRDLLLPQYATDFIAADLTETGVLVLSAVDKYSGLPAGDKKAIMTNITAAWRGPLVMVRYGSKTELWGWNGETGTTELLDAWDRHPSPVALLPSAASRLPGFFYFGDQLGINGSTVNLSFNARVGCYMLDNTWDCAATFSYVFTGTTDAGNSTMTNDFSFGIMGRRHFLIPNSDLSPNGGVQLMATTSGGTFTPTFSGVVGISWFVGGGSVDCDVIIGNTVSAMIGYTISPTMVKR